MAAFSPTGYSQRNTFTSDEEWSEILRAKGVQRREMPTPRIDTDNKRTSMSRHVLIRNLTTDWIVKETEQREDVESIISEQKRIKEGRKQALWKSWVYHVAAPLANSVQNHINCRCMMNMRRTRRNLYQKYLDYCKNPNHVISLDFPNLQLYDPFVLKNNRCLKLVTSPLHEPFLMKWKDREMEEKFIKSEWPLTSAKKERKTSRISKASVYTKSRSMESFISKQIERDVFNT